MRQLELIPVDRVIEPVAAAPVGRTVGAETMPSTSQIRQAPPAGHVRGSVSVRMVRRADGLDFRITASAVEIDLDQLAVVAAVLRRACTGAAAIAVSAIQP